MINLPNSYYPRPQDLSVTIYPDLILKVKMAEKKSYSQYLKEQFKGLIDSIELDELQKKFIKTRWLEQLVWLENKANKCRDKYYKLRMTTIIGGVIVPALITSTTSINDSAWLGLVVIIISQAVAISAAIEEFFKYGDKHTQYRQTAEKMKSEAWQFFQLSGAYRDFKTHKKAYVDFAQAVENIIQDDLHNYLARIVWEKEKEEEEKSNVSSKTVVSLDRQNLQKNSS